jgi:hypothetical protein
MYDSGGGYPPLGNCPLPPNMTTRPRPLSYVIA